MSTRPSLSFRVRYEGKVQTFDRRPLKEKEAEQARTSIRYMVAHSLSPFRKKLAKLEAPAPEIPAANPVKKKKRRARKSATSAVVPGK